MPTADDGVSEWCASVYTDVGNGWLYYTLIHIRAVDAMLDRRLRFAANDRRSSDGTAIIRRPGTGNGRLYCLTTTGCV